MKLWLGGIFVGTLLLVGVFILSSDTLDSAATSTATEPEGALAACPTTNTFNTIWNQWSYEYINNNPYADVDEQIETWNALMVQNGCSEEWFDPLADLIEAQAGSSTPVYWFIDT